MSLLGANSSAYVGSIMAAVWRRFAVKTHSPELAHVIFAKQSQLLEEEENRGKSRRPRALDRT